MVEAVILAAGTGLPILTLSLTLTVRIILLCLTSLPLALLALIGIAGMPLSSYIILFFRFLRNRRTLSKTGGKSSRKQAILPTWDKKSGPSTAVQPAAYKKDGSRIRFAKDTRRLMLDTAYRQKKQAERPGNPLAAYVPIQKIENGIVYTTDHRFIKILEIVPINFLLRSAREQRNIVYSFISYLKIAPVKLQIKVITKRADMNRHIETVRREMAQETNESCRMQQEDYLKLLKKLGSREAIARRFFLIMEYEPLPGAKKDREEADAISSLQTAARTAANYLRQCGNSVVQHPQRIEYRLGNSVIGHNAISTVERLFKLVQLLKNVTCAPDAIPIHQIFDCQRCAHIIGCNLTHILTRRGKICTQIPFRIKNRESLRLLADNCSILWENVLVKLPLRKIHTSKKCLDRRNHRCISRKPIKIHFQLLKGLRLLFLPLRLLLLPLFKTLCCVFLRYTHKRVANILMRGNKIKRNIIFFTVYVLFLSLPHSRAAARTLICRISVRHWEKSSTRT